MRGHGDANCSCRSPLRFLCASSAVGFEFLRTLGKSSHGANLTIDPVTRIEGHSKITIRLDDAGNVDVARLHITQFRGFEKFVEGRPFHEMPSLTARTCGICPISHLLASAKACDDLMAVRIRRRR